MLSEWFDTSITKLTVYSILTRNLSLRSVTYEWVLHELSDQSKETRVNRTKHVCKVFHRQGLDNIFHKLTVQDESYESYESRICFKGRSRKALNKYWPRTKMALK